jgi:cell division protein FtsI/penicillin-binding protein 2
MVNQNYRFRSYVVVIILMTAFGCLIAKLFSIQVMEHKAYAMAALSMRTQKIRLYPRRGQILDRNGKVLAASKVSGIVCLDPKIINNPEATGEKEWLINELAVILSMDAEDVRAKAERKNKKGNWLRRVWLKRNASDDEIAALEKMISDPENFLPDSDEEKPENYRYRGISFQERMKRIYPHGRLLCHVLGYMSNDPNPDYGVVRDDNNPQKGIEKVADKWLKGSEGHIIREKDRRGRGISEENIEEVAAKNGYSVQLTIDRNIQDIAEHALRAAYEDWSCSAASIVVMQATTGEILALANLPDFDPGDLSEIDKEQLINIAVEHVYEPGSILKAITGLIALDEGLVDLDSKIYCEKGYWRAPTGTRIRDSHANGELTFLQVISESSNIGICKAVEPLGKEGLYNNLLEFGFKSKTGCGLDGEVAGILAHPKDWWVKLYQIPFGHGISVTAMQMVTAFSVIVNDGLLVQPHIIKKVIGPDGRAVVDTETSFKRQVVAAKSTKKMRKALEAVTMNGGTAPKANLDEYTEGGKTGTAQVPLPTGGYGENFNSSFVGYAPAGKPEVIILVTLFNTRRPDHFGGKVAAPVFREVAYKTLKYLTVVPDEKEELARSRKVR